MAEGAATRTARRTHSFTESVIREMTRVARQHDAINLAQGFPDFEAPLLIKEAACEAIMADINQYAITWGSASLREALVGKYESWYDMPVDGDREVTVTCGATEAMAATMLAIIDPGDEVIILEPFYENYGPDSILSQAVPKFLPLEPPDYALDTDRLASLVSSRTKAIVINTPNNPTGRVFTRAELKGVADVCRKHDLLAITDTLDGMRERTITVSGFSKTFSVTGWRVGTIIAPPDITDAIRKVHDFLTVGAPAPLQEACATAMRDLGRDYYEAGVEAYRERREALYSGLEAAGFQCSKPEGAYYVLADFSELSTEDDVAFAHRLAKEARVASVPGSSFFSEPSRGRNLVRFAFCKRLETLIEAGHRLEAFGARAG